MNEEPTAPERSTSREVTDRILTTSRDATDRILITNRNTGNARDMTQATMRTTSETFTEFQHGYLMTNETEGALLNEQEDQTLEMNPKFNDDGSELSHRWSDSGSKVSEQMMESKNPKKSVAKFPGRPDHLSSPDSTTGKDSLGHSPN